MNFKVGDRVILKYRYKRTYKGNISGIIIDIKEGLNWPIRILWDGEDDEHPLKDRWVKPLEIDIDTEAIREDKLNILGI